MKQLFTFLAFLLIGSLAAQDIEEGLVIYYPLDGNLTDVISGETADNNGNLTFDEGILGQAVRFFNPDAYFLTERGALQVGPSEDGGTGGTFSLFVNHRAATLDSERHNYIAQKNGCGPEDNNRGRVVLYRQGPNEPAGPDSIQSFIGGQRLLSDYGLTEGDTWIHLTLTIDPEIREWALFVDGVENKRDTFPGSAQAENSCGEFVIGHHLTFTNENQTFDGLMDDLRFYNRVLTQEEITLLANLPTSTREVVVADAFELAPNPVAADQPINLAIDHSVFSAGSSIVLNVIDASGRKVMERQYDGVTNRLTLDHGLTSGFYTVTLTDGERLATMKLVVN